MRHCRAGVRGHPCRAKHSPPDGGQISDLSCRVRDDSNLNPVEVSHVEKIL